MAQARRLATVDLVLCADCVYADQVRASFACDSCLHDLMRGSCSRLLWPGQLALMLSAVCRRLMRQMWGAWCRSWQLCRMLPQGVWSLSSAGTPCCATACWLLRMGTFLRCGPLQWLCCLELHQR